MKNHRENIGISKKKDLLDSMNIRLWKTFKSENCASVRTSYVSERCSSFHSKFPFPLRFHIELHTRKSFGLGLERARYKFDVDMDMESNISAYLVSSSFSRRSSSGRTFFRLSQCSFRWQNRLWFVPGFNLKIVRHSKQYARKPASYTLKYARYTRCIKR